MATDYNILFNEEKLKGENLTYNLQGVAGCSMKLENESPYVVQVFSDGILKEMVQPYSFVMLKNDRPYTVEVKKEMKTESQQDYQYIGVKYIEGSTAYNTGSTNFNGQQRVNIQNVAQMELVGENEVVIANTPKVELQGDANVNIQNVPKVELFDNTVTIGGTPTVNLQDNTVQIAGTPEVILQGEATVNIANTPKVEVNNVVKTETTINNEVVNVAGQVEIVSGTVNANIENAEIKTELMNTSIATTPMTILHDLEAWDLVKAQDYEVNHEIVIKLKSGIYDNFVVTFDMMLYDHLGIPYPMEVGQFNETLSLEFFYKGISMFYENGYETGYEPAPAKGEIVLPRTVNPFNDKDFTNDLPVTRTVKEFKLKDPKLMDEIRVKVKITGAFVDARHRHYIRVAELIGYNDKSFKNIKEGGDAYLTKVRFPASVYAAQGGVLDMRNSDLIGGNNFYMNDTAQATEGFYWKKTGTPSNDYSYAGHDVQNVLDGIMRMNGETMMGFTQMTNTKKATQLPQSIYTKIDWGATDKNFNGSDYIIPVDGFYLIHANLTFISMSTATKRIYIRIALNDDYNYSYGSYLDTNYAQYSIQQTTTGYFKKGDRISVYGYSSDTVGANIGVSAWNRFEIACIQPVRVNYIP